MPRDGRTVSVPLALLRFSTSPHDRGDGGCMACDGQLELNQPDPAAPDRMVGVCERCGRWHLIEIVPGTDDAVMVLLPENGYFRNAPDDDPRSRPGL